MTSRYPRSRCAGSFGQSGAQSSVELGAAGHPGNALDLPTPVAPVAPTEAGPAWHRVVRYTRTGQVLEWVEVGQCARCGRGVDREFPREYVEVAGTVLCRACAPATDGTDRRARGNDRAEPAGSPSAPGAPGAQRVDGPEINASSEGAAA